MILTFIDLFGLFILFLFIDRRFSIQPACGDLQSQVLKCYRENAGKTLTCSSIASAYMQCVDDAKKVQVNLNTSYQASLIIIKFPHIQYLVPFNHFNVFLVYRIN